MPLLGHRIGAEELDPAATEEELRAIWAAQTMFPKEGEAMKVNFRELGETIDEGNREDEQDGKDGQDKKDEEDEDGIFIGQGLNRARSWDLQGLLRIIRKITRGSGINIEVVYQAWMEVLELDNDDGGDKVVFFL